MAASDGALITRALVENDTRAFSELVQRHQSRVRGWLRHLAGDAALADDLAQETFLKAWRRLSSYRSTGSFEAWLFTIARNEFRQSLRKAGRDAGHRERLRHAAGMEAEGAAPFEGEHTDVGRFLAHLGDAERDTMVLVYGAGLSHAEASEVLALPLGTVKSHVRRARLKIRERFDLTGPNDE